MIRDKRIDTIGCLDELDKQLGEKLRDAVKATMKGKRERDGEGGLFQALYIPDGDATVVDPAKFMKLLDGLEISRKGFLECLSVKTKEASKLLSAPQLKRVSYKVDRAAQLRVSRKADTIVDVGMAVKCVLGAVKGGN